MQLPGAEDATVSAFKIREYLLSFEHPMGRSKAMFFSRLGFTPTNWRAFRRALVRHAVRGDARPLAPDEFGQKYVVRGIIEGPTGRIADIVSVWIILTGERSPRLVTAYRGDVR